jgi:hypothetical protein
MGFLSNSLGGTKIRFFHSLFFVPMTILGILCGVHAPMLLAEVAILLGVSIFGNLARVLRIRPLVSFSALVRRLLVELCIGFFLCLYELNSLERQEKQMYVRGSHLFLV